MTFQEEVIEILKNKAADIFGVDASSLGPNTRFKEDLHAKSVNIVQFSAALEDEYEIEVPFMELDKKDTFADAAAYVDGLLSM